MVDYKAAYEEWSNKTDWVQETATPRELGKHRADVLKDRITRLKTRCDDLEAEAQRLSDHATALREIAGRRGKSVMTEIMALKTVVSNFKDEDIIKTGREMAHNLSGNGFLFLDEEQLIRFARELVARALGCEYD
jgi:hypothetical protein